MSYDEGEAVRDGYEEERAAARRPRPQRDGTINNRQDRAWRAAETLDNLLDSASSRLGPVLLPERPSPALNGVVQDAADTSEHGAFLDHLTDRLDALGRRLGDLLERVDL